MTELTTQPPEEQPRGGLDIPSIFLLLAVTAFVGVIGVQLARQNSPLVGQGDRAPDFTVTTFDEEEIALSEMRGQIVIVNFWASWCGPCIDEAPMLESVWQTYRDQDVLMLGITHADVSRDSLEFIERYGITYPNAPDPGARIYDTYNAQGVPETFIVGPDGRVAWALYGPLSESTMPEFERTIESLLAEVGA